MLKSKLFIFTIFSTIIIAETKGQDFVIKPSLKYSNNRYVSLKFENDFPFKTDYYFSNGFNISIIMPELQTNPIANLLAKPLENSINYYGLELVQNIYTPVQVEIADIITTDRPYASELYLKTFMESYNHSQKTKKSSEILLGFTGKFSLGENIQSSFHRAIGNSVPAGWKNQIKTDIIINYSYQLEQSILSLKFMEMNYSGKIRVGTLYDDMALNIYLRTGMFNNYFSGIGQVKKSSFEGENARLFQCYVYMEPEVKYIAYNAMLQGGVFNNSLYEMTPSQMEPIVFRLKTGVTIQYKFLHLRIGANYLSPEIKSGREHKWAEIEFRINF